MSCPGSHTAICSKLAYPSERSTSRTEVFTSPRNQSSAQGLTFPLKHASDPPTRTTHSPGSPKISATSAIYSLHANSPWTAHAHPHQTKSSPIPPTSPPSQPTTISNVARSSIVNCCTIIDRKLLHDHLVLRLSSTLFLRAISTIHHKTVRHQHIGWPKYGLEKSIARHAQSFNGNMPHSPSMAAISTAPITLDPLSCQATQAWQQSAILRKPGGSSFPASS